MLRSLLFVPAKDKMLQKISVFSSDGYIIDLEDSINEDEKEKALEVLCSFLTKHNIIPNIYVRLNKERYYTEAMTLHCFNIGFMLPKFEDIKNYNDLEFLWSQHSVIALIETPLGIVNLQETAKCSWIDALAFGAEDYTAKMNMQNNDELLLSTKSLLVTYAKAYSKKSFDTPSFKISNQEEFEKEVTLSVSLGFDGKLLINPKQIDFVNKTFGEVDIEHLTYVVSEYDKRGTAVAVINGKIYEKMHINRYRRIINEHKTI
jgi:citrate lyase subunit beta/citryl-CoA lyase